jgi:hypothetical protein
MSKQIAVTKNIKVSEKLAERLAKHGGFHTSYADIIESLLDFYEKQRPGKRVTDENEEHKRQQRI